MKNDSKTHSSGLYQNHCNLNVSRNYHNGNISSVHSSKKHPVETLEKAEKALSQIPNDLERDDWFRIACSLKSEFGEDAMSLFINWSENGKKSDGQNSRSTWKSASAGKAKIATLYYFARNNGYVEESQKVDKVSYAKQQQEQAERKARIAREAEKEAEQKLIDQQRAQTAINEVTPLLSPAIYNSTIYIANKKCNGKGAFTITRDAVNRTSTARYTYPFNDIKKGALVIPFQNSQGECVGMQCIYEGKKRIVKGGIKKESYAYLGVAPMPDTTSTIYIGEGYASVNTGMQADDESFGVMAIDADNLPLVAKLIRERHQQSNIVILGDNDKSGVGQSKAKEASKYANSAIIPEWIEGQIKSTDLNDVHVINGIDAVKRLLNVVDSSFEINQEPQLDYSDCYIPDDSDTDYDGLVISVCADNLPIVTTPIEPIAIPDQITNKEKTRITSDVYAKLKHDRDYKDAIKQLKKMKANSKTLARICHRYALAGLVAAIDLGYTSIALIQDMKAGKTYSIGWIKEHHPDIDSVLYISHLEAINDSTSRRLRFTFYKNIHGDCEVITITCTLNSLPKTLEKIGRYGFDMVVFDEMEGISQFIASGTITNKAQAGIAIEKVCAESRIVVTADAHMGANSWAFTRKFIKRDFVTLKNTYKQWAGVEHFWLDSRDKGFSHMVHSLKNSNSPLFVYSTSSALAYKAYEFCKKEGVLDGKSVLLACDKTSGDKDVIDAKNNNFLFNNYDVVFASPTIGIGISIETPVGKEPHFENAVCFFVRDKNTGNTASALQMPFRTRDIKRLACVKVDQINESNLTFDLSAARQKFNGLTYIKSLLIRESYRDENAANSHLMLSQSHLTYEAEIARNDIEDTHNYYEIIEKSLLDKGLVVVEPNYFDNVSDIKGAISEINEDRRQEDKKRVIEADDKTPEERIALSTAQRFNSNSLTEDEKNSLKKGNLIDNYFSNDAKDISDKELSDAYDICNNEGLHIGRKQMQSALQPKEEIAKICENWTSGNNESQVFMKDEASHSAVALQQTTKLDRILLDTINIECVDNVYFMREKTITNDDKSRDTITKLRKVKRGFDAVSSSRMPTVKKLNNAPEECIVDLLRKRFNIKANKVRKQKLDIIKRQKVNISKCEFKAIGEIITRVLCVNQTTNEIMTRSIDINNDSLCVKGFDELLTTEIVEQYNHFVMSSKSKKHQKITNHKRSDAKKLFIQLSKSLLNIKFSKINDTDEWEIPSEQPVIQNLNIAEYNDNNNLRNLYAKICAEKGLDGNGIKSEAKKLLGITIDTEAHIKSCLTHIHANKHHAVLREYIKIASQDSAKKSKFTPLATANIYLLDEAGITAS